MASALVRSLVIGSTAFLTLVDLFATQAILPALAAAYDVGPAAMGLAVNAATLGMAAGSLGVALASRAIERRRGVMLSLALLSVPTAPSPRRRTSGPSPRCASCRGVHGRGVRAHALVSRRARERRAKRRRVRRVHHRQCGEQSLRALGGARRLRRPRGQLLCLRRAQPRRRGPRVRKPVRSAPATMPAKFAWTEHLANARLRAAFAIGFFILFAFIGTFTYVNFVLVRAARPFDDGARLRVLRLRPLDPHHAARRPRGRALRHSRDALGVAGGCGHRPAASLGVAFDYGGYRPCARRRRHLLCAGGRHRICRRAATTERGPASGLYLAAYSSAA